MSDDNYREMEKERGGSEKIIRNIKPSYILAIVIIDAFLFAIMKTTPSLQHYNFLYIIGLSALVLIIMAFSGEKKVIDFPSEIEFRNKARKYFVYAHNKLGRGHSISEGDVYITYSNVDSVKNPYTKILGIKIKSPFGFPKYRWIKMDKYLNIMGIGEGKYSGEPFESEDKKSE